GFQALLPTQLQSPFITSFHNPTDNFDFHTFYAKLKERGFVIYPGKVTRADTFRIGTIGDIHPDDIERLLKAVADVSDAMQLFTASTAANSPPRPNR
ncbi:MAG: hypothetical protein VB861_18090, partial [Planctomycetaceae bacterium]